MTARPVRVRGVMDLEAERMLQEVARLLAQAGDDHGPRSDIHDLQLLQFWQVSCGCGELFPGRLLVRAFTSSQLCGRAEVTDTDVSVVRGANSECPSLPPAPGLLSGEAGLSSPGQG